jgi:hypothetical protein
MVKLKKTGASTLPEVIISMMIAIFMFGFIAWSLVSIDQRKSIEKDIALFQFQLNTDDVYNKNDLRFFNSREFSIVVIQSPSPLHENLTERTIEIKNKKSKMIYSFKLLQLRNNDENEPLY